MGYVQQTLGSHERLIIRGRWPLVFWLCAWAALLLLGIILVGIYLFARAAITMLTTEFAVTDSRVVLKTGWLNVRTQEISASSIEGVQLVQSIWGKLFGYGRIMVTGTGDARLVFPPMAEPIKFRRAIETARDEEDER